MPGETKRGLSRTLSKRALKFFETKKYALDTMHRHLKILSVATLHFEMSRIVEVLEKKK